jgi:hypothetical protein
VTNRRLCNWITVGLISALAAIAVQAQSKPTREQRIFVQGTGAPASIAELFDKSTVVVDGIITSERPADYVPPGQDPKEPVTRLTQTSYAVKVIEFFKDSGSGRQSDVVVEMVLPGGRRDRGLFVDDYYDRRLPTPVLGEEYILFLRLEHSRSMGSRFVPTKGFEESIFLVTLDRVVPRGASPVARSFNGALATSFKEVLRKHRGKL